MPFVLQEKREKLDRVISAMVDADIKCDGDLNYILYKWCKYHVTPSYNSYKNFLGELLECAAQCRNDFLVPYERKKEIENGSI